MEVQEPGGPQALRAPVQAELLPTADAIEPGPTGYGTSVAVCVVTSKLTVVDW
jgi:hypothetical protein